MTLPRSALFLVVLSGLVFALPDRAWAGRLDDVQRASGPSRSRSSGGSSRSTHSESSGSSTRSSSHSHEWRSSGGGGSRYSNMSDDDAPWGKALLYLLTFPIIVPLMFDDACVHGYAAYPDRDGFLRSAAWDEQCVAKGLSVPRADTTRAAVVRKFAGSTGFEASYGLGGLGGASVSGGLLLPNRIDVSVRLQMLADLSERPTDQALLTTSSLGIRLAQTERVAVRFGAGLRTFFLDERRLGPDAFYAISVFGRYGLRWEFEAHVGALSQAVSGQLRATFGVMLRRFELYAGYDYFHVRGPTTGATLQGPVAGLRVWL